MNSAIAVLAADTELPEPVAGGWQLILAALAGIAVIVVLITVFKLHPFLSLIFGGLTVGIVAGESLTVVLKSFTTGFGSTAASVGILIALGAMFAKLLADSGGADELGGRRHVITRDHIDVSGDRAGSDLLGGSS